MLMPEPFRYRNKGTQSGTGMLRYRTEMQDAGMPKPAASTSMPMPSYGVLSHPIPAVHAAAIPGYIEHLIAQQS